MKYANPVISGFHPDPSICRVGSDYYLVASSFTCFPGVPVFCSRDLVHWRLLGHCLTRRGQLDLTGAECSAGIWAPTIRRHQGLFYLITTNVSHGGNFYVTADDPEGEWSDPIWVDADGIDPSLFFDDDGTVYYTRREGSDSIVQAEIDVRTGKLLAKPRAIARGFSSPDIEGPHLYKIGGRYYLVAAEGGSRFGHSVTIGRAQGPWGPFTPCPHNPILTHRHLSGGPIRATGHGDLFQAHDDGWWMVFLGTRHSSYDGLSHLGRETFLAPVSWTHDGWPVVNGGRPIESEMVGDFPTLYPWPPASIREDFDGAPLDAAWVYLRNPHDENYSLSERPGHLRLKGTPATLNALDSPTFVGRRQEHLNCRFLAKLEFCPAGEGDEAGVSVYLDRRHHYEIAVTLHFGERCAAVRRTVDDLEAVVACVPLEDGPVVFSIEADPVKYAFAMRQEEGEALPLATGQTKLLGTELAASWTGVVLGLYATGNGRTAPAPADFDWAEYHPAA